MCTPGTPHSVVVRAQVCLLAHSGKSNSEIARDLGISRPTVIQWRTRFAAEGSPALEHGRERRSAGRGLPAEKINAVVDTTLRAKPQEAAHWSTRNLARHLGVSRMTVSRVWDRHGLQPGRDESVAVSDQPPEAQLQDVVGVYVNPPDRAFVLQIKPLPQTETSNCRQAELPTVPERRGRQSLTAALQALNANVVGGCFRDQRHATLLQFLRRVDRQTPMGLNILVITNDCATFKHGAVTHWIQRRPRLEFRSTSEEAWLDQIADLISENRRRTRPEAFTGFDDLKQAVDHYNAAKCFATQHFAWTKRADELLKALGYRQTHTSSAFHHEEI